MQSYEETFFCVFLVFLQLLYDGGIGWFFGVRL